MATLAWVAPVTRRQIAAPRVGSATSANDLTPGTSAAAGLQAEAAVVVLAVYQAKTSTP